MVLDVFASISCYAISESVDICCIGFSYRVWSWLNRRFQRFLRCHSLCRSSTGFLLGCDEDFPYSAAPLPSLLYLDAGSLRPEGPVLRPGPASAQKAQTLLVEGSTVVDDRPPRWKRRTHRSEWHIDTINITSWASFQGLEAYWLNKGPAPYTHLRAPENKAKHR